MSDFRRDAAESGAAPANLSEILSGLVSQFGIGKKRESDELVDAWKELAGGMADYSTVGGIRRGVLEIVVSDAIFVQELMFQKEVLLKQLRERLPEAGLEDLRFRIGNAGVSQGQKP